MENIIKTNNAITELREFLIKHNNPKWIFPDKKMSVNLIIIANNTKMSVNINRTYGIVYETISYDINGELEHDTLCYHETVDELVDYLRQI